MAYHVQGDGPHYILYMSGMLVSIDAMDDEPHVALLHRRLGSIGRLIQFDPPGLGLSDALAGELTLERIADCARAVLDALRIEWRLSARTRRPVRGCIGSDGRGPGQLPRPRRH